MLIPRTLALVRPQGRGPVVQAALELSAARLLEGRIQAALVEAEWGEESILLGLYQPAPEGAGRGVRRRITGGWEAEMLERDAYTGIVVATESLEETVELARRVAECLGARAWGATRLGPRRLAAGVVEVLGGSGPGDGLRCLEDALGARLSASPLQLPRERLLEVARAYEHPGWRLYPGARGMEKRARIEAPPYWIGLGISTAEGLYIASARIEGVFHAAPPNEPFNLAAALEGMPLGEQAEMLAHARASLMEIHGPPPDAVPALIRRLAAAP